MYIPDVDCATTHERTQVFREDNGTRTPAYGRNAFPPAKKC